MSTATQTAPTPADETIDAGDRTRQRDPLDRLLWLPCTLVLEVPVSSFTVGSLLRLEVGSIVETSSHHNADLPLEVNGQLLGFTEFEVVGERLAVRLTGVL